YWHWQPDDVLLHALPIYHVHGLFVATHCVLLTGTQIVWHEKFDVDRVIDDLPKCTVMMGVPTYYSRLLRKASFNRDIAQSMRLFISGSAPLAEQTFEQFEKRSGFRILERYGMSETLMNTSNPVNGQRNPGTVGFPLPGVDVRVVDDTGEVLPPSDIGNIEVRGPNVFDGYWRMPLKKSSEFSSGGYFKTGDMGLLDVEGRLTIVGREKDVVISGGLNIYPAEIESSIDEYEGIVENAVVGAPHPDFGEGLIAVVVSTRPIVLSELRRFLHNRLAGFKHPKALKQLDELPRNAMGKIQKNVLRERFADTFMAIGGPD
ncbi:MAG: AMP-binding protein, partial [Gammaproteobacteria bacterium]|nr:AMP-binding protein [Gammaproteobacteria bacterium]